MKTTKTIAGSNLPGSFEALCKLHMLRPITDEVSFENAQEISDALAVLDKRTTGQDEYLESLSILMEHYENEHWPIKDKTDPIDILKYLMEGRKMSESDLGRLLGERSLGHAVLAGKRSLSKTHIKALSQHFSVSPALFL